MLTEDLTQLILKHNIISFDIFDTALLRPYIKPTHLFLHIEKYLKVNNFASLRCKSEKMARKEMFKNFQKEDITIDDIYKNMPSDMRYIKDIDRF